MEHIRLTMYVVAAVFGVPLLSTMTNPEGLRLVGLINYTLVMLVLMPFGGGWQLRWSPNSSCQPPAVVASPPC
jgi:uncharacterized membrane protein YqjE